MTSLRCFVSAFMRCTRPGLGEQRAVALCCRGTGRERRGTTGNMKKLLTDRARDNQLGGRRPDQPANLATQGITEHTVRNYLFRIFNKLGTSNPLASRKGKTDSFSARTYYLFRMMLTERTRSMLESWRLRFEVQHFVEDFHLTSSHSTQHRREPRIRAESYLNGSLGRSAPLRKRPEFS